jgi:hypothetical protein
MSPCTERRHHPRVSVEWPVLYSTPAFLAHGTVVDVSVLAWRVEGSRSVVAGMQIAVELWLHPSAPLKIQQARVLWATEHEFALEIVQVCPEHELELITLQEHTLGQNRTSAEYRRDAQESARRGDPKCIHEGSYICTMCGALVFAGSASLTAEP